jgi:hypothetical protein
MNQNHDIKIPLLRSMGDVYEESKRKGFSEDLLSCLSGELNIVSAYFEVNKMQAFLLSLIFAIQYRDNEVTINDLIQHLSCNPLKMLEYSSELDDLEAKGILRKRTSRSYRSKNENFTIYDKIVKAILSNQPLPQESKPQLKNIIDLIQEVDTLYDDVRENEISGNQFFKLLKNILSENKEFPLIKTFHNNHLDILDVVMFLKLIWSNLNGYYVVRIEREISEVVRRRSAIISYLQSYAKNENSLLKMGWIELYNEEFLNNAEIALSEAGFQMLREAGIELKMEKTKNSNVIPFEKIADKKLYFNERENRELDLLYRTLNVKNLEKLHQRLEKTNYPSGITILLHGKPGTGKTETALQLAKKTGREIYKVDISDTKSKWFGESEKIIKRIFNDYRDYAAGCSKTPILLFNEADAILSKRKDPHSSNVAQTENAIQNIILDELENFQGIFVATTNLVGNLDDAFSRRFLFKIKFDQPTAEVKALIWKSKMPSLKKDECMELAKYFDFSGGQIDNIIRKCETHYIVYGKRSSINHIFGFCRSEVLETGNSSRIGFEWNK